MRVMHNVRKLWQGYQYAEAELDAHDERLGTVESALASAAIQKALTEQESRHTAALAAAEARHTAALNAHAVRSAKALKDVETALDTAVATLSNLTTEHAERFETMSEAFRAEDVKLEIRLDVLTKTVSHWYDKVEDVKAKATAAADALKNAVSSHETHTAQLDLRLVDLDARLAALSLRVDAHDARVAHWPPSQPETVTVGSAAHNAAGTPDAGNSGPNASSDASGASSPTPSGPAPDLQLSAATPLRTIPTDDGPGASAPQDPRPEVNVIPPTPICSQEAAQDRPPIADTETSAPSSNTAHPDAGATTRAPDPLTPPPPTLPSAGVPTAPSTAPPALPQSGLMPPPTDPLADGSPALPLRGDDPEPNALQVGGSGDVQKVEGGKARRSGRGSSRPNSSATLDPPVTRNNSRAKSPHPTPAKR